MLEKFELLKIAACRASVFNASSAPLASMATASATGIAEDLRALVMCGGLSLPVVDSDGASAGVNGRGKPWMTLQKPLFAHGGIYSVRDHSDCDSSADESRMCDAMPVAVAAKVPTRPQQAAAATRLNFLPCVLFNAQRRTQ